MCFNEGVLTEALFVFRQDEFQLLPGAEDWSRFRWLVAIDNEIPDREEVLILIDKHSNDLVLMLNTRR